MAVILGRKPGGAAGGGSFPDPSGEPDGDVLTVSGGAAVWSPSGGSLPTYADAGLYSGNAVTVPDDPEASATLLTWDSLASGAAVLDLTVPTAPTVAVEGIYSVSVVVQTSAMTAGGVFVAVLHLDQYGEDAVCEMAQSYVPTPGRPSSLVSLNNTYYVPAGGVISASVVLDDGAAARDFNIREASIQRLS